MSYNENDVVIVSSGAILPGVKNPREFFDSLLEGQCHVRDLRDAEDLSYRPLYHLIHESDRKAHDATYSTMGADIPRSKLMEVAAQLKLQVDDSLFLHVMALEAVRQCLDGVLDEKSRVKTDLIFGSTDALTGALAAGLEEVFEDLVAEECFSEQERDMLREPIRVERKRFAPKEGHFSPPELCIPSHLSEKIMKYFDLGGLSFLVDAACASSMAALYLAQLRLQRGLCDFAVVGGADDCLGSGNMLSGFSKLGVLSESGPLPFDERSDGTVIGEGAVAFLVTTLGRAQKMNLPILGVVKGIGGSSDGKAGGLTEPTVAGQVRCYENTYRGERPELAYIECHGTGTVVGDQIEITSLSQFFADRRIPIGSVKFNFGHTMIAAGATSLLKALGILERKMIPPSRYFQQYPAGVETPLFLNRNVEILKDQSEPLNLGVSSFGFGGTNFHLWLQEYKPEKSVKKGASTKALKIVLCGEVEGSIDQVTELFSHTQYNIPPKIWPFIDRGQLLSVLLAEKLFREVRIRPGDIDQHRVHVISGTAQPLTLAREMVQRGLYKYSYRLLKEAVPTLEKKLLRIYERVADETTELNEQSAIGSINSLVASRVSKAFDFRGLNFTVDGDGASGMKALEMARTVLAEGAGAAIVLDSMKQFDERYSFLKTTGMKCYLLATEDFAHEFNLPLLAEINPLTFERRNYANT